MIIIITIIIVIMTCKIWPRLCFGNLYLIYLPLLSSFEIENLKKNF